MIGKIATISGRVVGTKYASSSFGSPTFLDIGAPYPNRGRFTVVIWLENRANFGSPENRYRGKSICIHGYVSSYRGTPQIEASSPSQIAVVR
jgi:DNA/RNA endonuclease YhcR with UshA esterase domain